MKACGLYVMLLQHQNQAIRFLQSVFWLCLVGFVIQIQLELILDYLPDIGQFFAIQNLSIDRLTHC